MVNPKYTNMLEALHEECLELMNSWEYEFVDSLMQELGSWSCVTPEDEAEREERVFTPKRREKLEEIYWKYQ